MRKDLLPIVILTPIIIIGFFILYFQQLHTDVLYFLYWTERVVDGARLYVDIKDINTPITFYFNYPIILVAKFLGLSVELTFKVFVVNLLFGIIFLCKKILSYSALSSKNMIYILLVLLLVFTLSGWDFGQREYLFSLLATPFVMVRIIYVVQKNFKLPIWPSLLSGLLAACGVGFKPYFVLPLLVLEIYIFLVKRNIRTFFRKECLSLVFSIIFQIAVILWFLPGYLENFLIGLQNYPYYVTQGHLFLRFETLLLIVSVVIFFYEYKKGISGQTSRILFLLILASWVAGIIQTKGFPQHYLPLRFVSLFYFSSAIYRSLGSRIRNDTTITKDFLTSLLLSLMLLTFWIQETKALNPPLSVSSTEYKLLVSLTKEKAENQKIALISTSFYPVVLFVHDANVGWATRNTNFWLVPGFYKNVDSREKPFPYHNLPK